MAEAKNRSEWGRTSLVTAVIANAHRDPKKSRAFLPKDFNPYATKQESKPFPKTHDLTVLKYVFVDNGRLSGFGLSDGQEGEKLP
jgi:hypothetical protein